MSPLASQPSAFRRPWALLLPVRRVNFAPWSTVTVPLMSAPCTRAVVGNPAVSRVRAVTLTPPCMAFRSMWSPAPFATTLPLALLARNLPLAFRAVVSANVPRRS